MWEPLLCINQLACHVMMKVRVTSKGRLSPVALLYQACQGSCGSCGTNGHVAACVESIETRKLLFWACEGGVIGAWCEVPELRCAGVTAPQLALLETTMLKMERVDTWVLMMGGGSGVDVFLVGAPCWLLFTLLCLPWRLTFHETRGEYENTSMSYPVLREQSHPQTSGCSRSIASGAFIIGTHHPCCSYTDRTQVSVMCAVTGLFHVLADSCRHA